MSTGHVLICGLGSIGRRHLRHFRALGIGRIDAYRSGLATLPDEGQPAPDRVFTDLEEAVAERPEVVVVANPTALHVPTALAAVRAGCAVLLEKPVSHALDGCDALLAEARASGVPVSVACNLRFHPSVRLFREWVLTGEPLGRAILARGHFGAYLPDWHPWEDYRKGYAGRRDLGGGATLTSIHEIDTALWLFGPVRDAHCASIGFSPLGTDIQEAAGLLLSHQSGTVSTITLSLAQKPASRSLEVNFERGTATLDLLTGRWVLRHHDVRVEEGGPPEGWQFDDTYRDQAIAILASSRHGAPVSVTLEEGMAALRIAVA